MSEIYFLGGILSLLLMLTVSIISWAENHIVYTANNGFDTRIYLIAESGKASYFEFSFMHFADIEVVNNELYLVETLAPRIYKMDLKTGQLDVVVDDLSLSALYSVFSDGKYIYTQSGSLRRYDFSGKFLGTAPISDFADGAAIMGGNLWTLADGGVMKSWDLSNWPKIKELVHMRTRAPSKDCLGLFSDGQGFWCAENGSMAGYIYRFDQYGKIIMRYKAPAFGGYAAGIIDIK